VRQLVFAQYGNETYTRGLNVYTTVKSADQEAAYKALRRGIMDFERRQIYRGPEKVHRPADQRPAGDGRRRSTMRTRRPSGQRRRDVGRGAGGRTPKLIRAIRQNAEVVDITGDGLKAARSGLSATRPSRTSRSVAGAVIRVAKTSQGHLGNHPVAGGRRCLCRHGPARRCRSRPWSAASITRRTSSTM
jgi:penicillin-binding protein 1A